MAIIEVVKFEGHPDALAWKYTNDELGTWTQLIVNESQEAVLYKGGKVCDLFTAGRHTLETANIPILNKLVNLPFGGESPFSAEVWFINKNYALDIKWGTPSPIQMQDPKYKVFIPLRSYGQFGIQVIDSKKFLIKLVGTQTEFSQDSLQRYFKGLYLTNVKDAISSYLLKNNVSALEMNAYLIELSEHIKNKMVPIFDEFGIQLVNFFVNDISIPEDDSAVIQLKAALAKKAEMDILGYDYAQERSFDTLLGAATNQGSTQSALMGAGLGLGMGAGIGSAFGGSMSNLTNVLNLNGANQNAQSEQKKSTLQVTCAECGSCFDNTSKFCPECGNIYNACLACGADLETVASKCHICGVVVPKPCPKCNAIISTPNVKFCNECGESLLKKCSICQSTIEGSPKFCPECGGKL